MAFSLVGAACGGSDGASEGAANEPGSTATPTAAAVADPSPTPDPPAAPAEADPTPAPTLAPVPDVALGELIPAFESVGFFAATELPTVTPGEMCPGWDPGDGLTLVDVATRTFRGAPQLGPFFTIGILEFEPGEAGAYLDAYVDGAAGPCAQYETTGNAGEPLSLGWSETAGPEYGDRTVTLKVRGDSSGFPINSEVVLIQVGDRVGYVGTLVLGSETDLGERDAAAAAIVSALGGENIGTIPSDSSAAAIAAVLPGLDELANPGLLSESDFPAIPDAQCPGNPSTLAGLTVHGAAARAFLATQDFGPFVTVSILEFGPGDADVFIDRWVEGATGPCTNYVASAVEFGWTVGSGPEYLDRTVTLFGRGTQQVLAIPVAADYVLVRSGDFVAYMHYWVAEVTAPDVAIRDAMAEVLVAALEAVAG